MLIFLKSILLTIPEFLTDPCVREWSSVPFGPPSWLPLALWKRRAPWWGLGCGTPLQGLVCVLPLLAAVGGASGVMPTALPEVTDSQILWTVIGVAAARVRGLGLKRRGRWGGLCWWDARDGHWARWGRHTPCALPWPGDKYPLRFQAAGLRGRVCKTARRKHEANTRAFTVKASLLLLFASIAHILLMLMF